MRLIVENSRHSAEETQLRRRRSFFKGLFRGTGWLMATPFAWSGADVAGTPISVLHRLDPTRVIQPWLRVCKGLIVPGSVAGTRIQTFALGAPG
jgi:hypothetical protein